MSTEKEIQRESLSVVSLLGVAFVVLKLLDKISWSWWWVTAPFWGPFALAAELKTEKGA